MYGWLAIYFGQDINHHPPSHLKNPESAPDREVTQFWNFYLKLDYELEISIA